MHFIWPPLDRDFCRIVICGHCHVSDATARGVQEETCRASYPSNGGHADVVLKIGPVKDQADNWHVHLEIGADWSNEPERNESPDSLDQLDSVLWRFSGISISQHLDATFVIARENLPEGGMIDALLGVSLRSCGSEMTLTGGRFAVRDSEFKDVAWGLDENQDRVFGNLNAECEAPVAEQYVVNTLPLMRRARVLHPRKSKGRDTTCRQQVTSSEQDYRNVDAPLIRSCRHAASCADASRKQQCLHRSRGQHVRQRKWPIS